MSKNGYILLHRSIMTHYAFEDEPKTAREAFIWLLMNASYSPHKTLYKGKIISVNRGQIPTSYRRLMAEFQWSLGRVQRYITRLVDEGMIDTATDTGFLVITICNYDKYQALSTVADTPTDTPTDTVTDTQTDTNIIKGIIKRKEKKDSDTNVSGESSPSVDFKKVIFDQGLKFIAKGSGKPESGLRPLVGKWVSLHGEAKVAGAIIDAQRVSAIDPIGYIQGIFARGSPAKATVRPLSAMNYRAGTEGFDVT